MIKRPLRKISFMLIATATMLAISGCTFLSSETSKSDLNDGTDNVSINTENNQENAELVEDAALEYSSNGEISDENSGNESSENDSENSSDSDDEEVEEVKEREPEYFVLVGNEETGDVISIGSYQYVADIHNIKITDLDAFKEQLKQLPNLLYIDMCDCGLSNEQMEDLMETFPSIRFVWMLRMTVTNDARTLWWKVRTDALAFSTLHAWATDPRLDNNQAQQLKYCENLVALDFGHNAIHDTSFMKDMDMHILITVDSFNRVENHKFDSLWVCENFPNLIYLEIFVGRVSDLSPIENCKELKDLNISYNPISEITYIKDFPKLERLTLESTKISYEDYKELCEIYPDTKITYYGSGSVDAGWRGHARYFAMIDMFRNNYWNDLFRTDDELVAVAQNDLFIVDGVRYYGTPYIVEFTEEPKELEPEVNEEDVADTQSGDNTSINNGVSNDGSAEAEDTADIVEVIPVMIGKIGEQEFTFERQIIASVGAGNIPTEDGECNFDAVGNYYSNDNGNGVILVLMADGKYHYFYKNEVLADILNEKLDDAGEIKFEYTRKEVEKRIAREKAEVLARQEAEAEEREAEIAAEYTAEIEAKKAEEEAKREATETDNEVTEENGDAVEGTVESTDANQE